MKAAFEITDEAIIDALIDNASYGTLALSLDERPYSVPMNFVQIEGTIYFHGAKKGRKMQMLEKNPYASFSIVESHALIPSYFSSDAGLACPATHFFKSVIIDGSVEMVETSEEKGKVLSALMQKLQPEGKYRPFSDKDYEKSLNATAVYKLIPTERRAKFKFGQHLDSERFEMIITHLEARGEPIDLQTVAMMRAFKEEKTI